MRQRRWLLGGAVALVAVAAVAAIALRGVGSNGTASVSAPAPSGTASSRPVLYEFYTDW